MLVTAWRDSVNPSKCNMVRLSTRCKIARPDTSRTTTLQNLMSYSSKYSRKLRSLSSGLDAVMVHHMVDDEVKHKHMHVQRYLVSLYLFNIAEHKMQHLTDIDALTDTSKKLMSQGSTCSRKLRTLCGHQATHVWWRHQMQTDHVQRYLVMLFTDNVQSRNTLAISTRLSTSLLHLRHSNNFVTMVSH